MKLNGESTQYLKPLMALMLLCFSVSFSGFASAGTVTHVFQTEWLQTAAAAKKAKTVAYSPALIKRTQKFYFSPFDFFVMQTTAEKDLILKEEQLNLNFSNYKNTLQKCLFRTSLKRSFEAPIFSEPV